MHWHQHPTAVQKSDPLRSRAWQRILSEDLSQGSNAQNDQVLDDRIVKTILHVLLNSHFQRHRCKMLIPSQECFLAFFLEKVERQKKLELWCKEPKMKRSEWQTTGFDN